MMREGYERTSCQGSTTILTATMDNSTKIHGKLHPMIAVCSVGDCEILVLRRTTSGSLAPAFHTEMQRVNGNAQCPLQLSRVDDSFDPNFDESTMIEVIEKGSAVHCVSAYEGIDSPGTIRRKLVGRGRSKCASLFLSPPDHVIC